MDSATADKLAGRPTGGSGALGTGAIAATIVVLAGASVLVLRRLRRRPIA
jgi:hypothetical protein